MGKSSGYLPGLTGLRGVAALMVFAYHARWRAGDPELPFGIHQLLRSMDTGVGIFFILSGFLLSLPFWKNILAGGKPVDLKAYLVRRISRIIPAYYAVVLVLYLLHPGTFTFYGGLDFFLHLGFLQNWTDYTYSSQLNPALWSIGIEFLFYLVLPILMAGMAGAFRVTKPAIATLAGLLFIFTLSYAAPPLLQPLKGILPERFISKGFSPTLSANLLFYLRYFAFGIFLAPILFHFQKKNPDRVRTIANPIGILSIVGLIFLLWNSGEGQWKLTGIGNYPTNAILIAILILTLPFSTIGKLLEGAIPKFIGEISYGIYLWHWPIQIAVFGGTLPGRLSDPASLLFCGAISLFFTILLASLSYWLIERPALQWAGNRPRTSSIPTPLNQTATT